ncbi:carbohydrate ABC transporter permease [Alkalibacterium sp. 20]|uniref:carbohydrate ABC transporter permease n=1 Tax=Alkalibacterium sp. 20 TaxID=1798803 RepID=UPI000AD9C958|nr:carbohydrate ABC transporter permease [Alkalibacterium sp. 20]
MKMTKNKILLYLLIIFFVFVTVGPFVFTLLMSLKGPAEGVYTNIFPRDPSLDNYFIAFRQARFDEYLINTVIAVLIAVPLNILFCSLAAYPLARMDFKGKNVILITIIATMAVPFQLFMAPLFNLVGNMGLRNSYIGLIVLQVGTAFGIFLIRQSYLTIPKALEESAYMDGANKFQVWFRIILPMIKPTLITLGIYTFTFTWGDYLWPLINTTDNEMYTLSIGLAQLSQSFDGSNIKLISAASLLTTIPSLAIFIWLQKYFVGTTKGAVKG